MDIRITPRSLSGSLDAISSKSSAHRLLICAGLSGRETVVRVNGLSDDVMATVRCLEAMGCSIKAGRRELTVSPMQRPPPESAQSSRVVLDCGGSGSTARFILPLAAHFLDRFTLTGSGSLPRRPFAPLCAALQEAGCPLDSDCLPMAGSGRISSGSFKIAGNVSSQFVSGLLLLLPLLDEGSSVTVAEPLESAGYVDMTIEAIALFGIAIEKTRLPPEGEGVGEGGSTVFRVRGNRRYDSPGSAAAENDWSNAAFFLGMGALGGPVSIRGLSMRSEQNDREIIGILRRFGAAAGADGAGASAAAPEAGGRLRGIEVDASQIPDLVPAIAAVAALAEGETRIFNAQRLRLKESDRIKTTREMLLALGADVKTPGGSIVIRGREKLRGGIVDGAGDHRIVMAAATASCGCEGPVEIRGFMAVNKSYPAFFGDFKTLGGAAAVF